MTRFGSLLLPLLLASSSLHAQAPFPRIDVIATKADQIVVTSMNGKGDWVGFEWREETKHPGVISQVPFFSSKGQQTDLPLLKGYTATFPAAVSDDGLVVGRVSRPPTRNAKAKAGVVPLNQAFVWTHNSGIQGLGMLKDDVASVACDVSSDGRRISGFSLGENRLRACIWEREGQGWRAGPLPQEAQLGSNTVHLSDDGNSAAAVDGTVPVLWKRDEQGKWWREVIGSSGSMIPRGLNNASVVVGIRHSNQGTTDAVVWMRGKGLETIKLPAGYTRAEASAVNNFGIIVGLIDGPAGSDVGPNGFVSFDGQTKIIKEDSAYLSSATCINDQGQVAGIVESLEVPTPGPGQEKTSSPTPR